MSDDSTGPGTGPRGDGRGDGPDLSGALEAVEAFLLGAEPSLTRVEVAARADVPLEVATELWRLMGFAHTGDDQVAFTEADVAALADARELIELGILSPDRQAALVRTWGRSYARLAEWQTSLLATVALEQGTDPDEALTQLVGEVLPRVEALQTYVWRRHLVSAGSRLLAVADPRAPATVTAVVFVDIVGYTSHSRTLSEQELVAWIEGFESDTLDLVVEGGGRIIKNIGDEVLFVADDVHAAAAIAVEMTRRGADEDDPFPAVRAGVAYGEVVARLGDVFGPTVNIASRLTTIARPGTVIVDRGAYEALSGRGGEDEAEASDSSGERDRDRDKDRDRDRDRDRDDPESAYSFRRLRRVSVKGYSRLAAWALRPRT